MEYFWIGLKIYLVIGFLHGLWVLRMQNKRHKKSTEWWRMLLVFFVNSVGWIITLPMVFYKKTLW